ncbi:MAG: transporter substrate-binding domain-containing protein [Thermoleophilia bacterium]|nr:transporter substrate-binding domain-containing protein [Thermoleophilia bacterium]
MRRLTALLVPLVLSLGIVGGVGAAHRAAPVSTLTFCTDPTFPPMELTRSSGAIFGFDVDMANAIAKQWGISAKAVKTAFPGLIPALKAKKCETVISGIFVTPDRLKQAGAVTYMHSHRVLLVKGGNPKQIKGPNDLKGRNVAVQAGTKYEEYLKALKAKIGFNLASYPGDTDAVAQILIGRADVVLTQDTSAAYQIGKHPGKLLIAYLFRQQDSFGIYYRKSDGQLGSGLRSAVASLKKNGTMAKLAAKYKLPAADVK